MNIFEEEVYLKAYQDFRFVVDSVDYYFTVYPCCDSDGLFDGNFILFDGYDNKFYVSLLDRKSVV